MSKRKVYRKEDGYLAEDLMQAALHHYGAASNLLSAPHAAHFDSGGYLLHLSFELLFKSWLLHLSGKFDGIHSLKSLREKIKQIDQKFILSKEENKVLDHLDTLYELRYPNRTNPIEIGSEELLLSKAIVEKIWSFIPNTLKKSFLGIPYGSKSGRILMVRPDDKPLDIKFILEK